MFYDGSGKISTDSNKISEKKPVEVTAEMRKSLGGNPYIFNIKK
ncbi:hypothetical protein [Mesobacillus foraminis]|nr:hypothetical protein [Mesobacillus foraminis]